jgi:hypothetical protein
MDAIGISQCELLFRRVASLDLDKTDVKRVYDTVDRLLRDLLARAEAVAQANGRDIMAPHDLPLTAGLDHNVDEFKRLVRTDPEFKDIRELVEKVAPLPPMDLGYSDELEREMPDVGGGLMVTIARTLRAIYPDLKQPQTREWEGLDAVFRVVL